MFRKLAANDIAAILAVVRADDKKDAHRTLATIPDEAQCIMDRVQQLYDLGVRRLVVMSNVSVLRNFASVSVTLC